MRSVCRRSIITMSAPARPRRHVVVHLDAVALDRRRQQRAGRDQAHPRPHRGEQQDVGARDPRVHDVAADRDHQALDAALAPADGERVEQRLGRMLVAAVAGVDHRAVDVAGEQRDRAAVLVAHHQHVRMHRVQGHRGVDQGLALLDRGRADRHVDDVGAEPLAGELERGARARRALEEQVDLGPAAQDRRASCRPGGRARRSCRRDPEDAGSRHGCSPSMPSRCRWAKVLGSSLSAITARLCAAPETVASGRPATACDRPRRPAGLARDAPELPVPLR